MSARASNTVSKPAFSIWNLTGPRGSRDLQGVAPSGCHSPLASEYAFIDTTAPGGSVTMEPDTDSSGQTRASDGSSPSSAWARFASAKAAM